MGTNDNTYIGRNATLRSLGYANYAHYLSSDLWAQIRVRAFALHGHTCKLCPDPAACLHHLGYGRAILLGERLSSIVPLCHGCHKQVEFDKRGHKRTVLQAHTAYVRMLKKVKRIARRDKLTKKERRERRQQRSLRCGICRTSKPTQLFRVHRRDKNPASSNPCDYRRLCCQCTINALLIYRVSGVIQGSHNSQSFGMLRAAVRNIRGLPSRKRGQQRAYPP